MLAEGAITITKSELERRFLAFLRRRRLPLPETNVGMDWTGRNIEADCVWREQRLIIELDGRAAHQTTSRFHADRLRDRKLDLAKWTVWRVTARHLDDELERDLRARLGAQPPSRFFAQPSRRCCSRAARVSFERFAARPRTSIFTGGRNRRDQPLDLVVPHSGHGGSSSTFASSSKPWPFAHSKS